LRGEKKVNRGEEEATLTRRQQAYRRSKPDAHYLERKKKEEGVILSEQDYSTGGGKECVR